MSHAIFAAQAGGPEVLEYQERPLPEPGAGQVRVKVAHAGVNFIDVYFRTGTYPGRFPQVLGVEGSGVVEALGEGSARFAVGDRVAWAMGFGSYATHMVASQDALIAVPDGIGLDVAAAAMLQGMTAHYLSHGLRTTTEGDVALVHAAAGGTGLLLVQMLAAAGATVIGTCSTPEKAELAKGAGAQHTIAYREQDVAARCRELTDGRGVDVVYDSVGQSTFDGSLASLRPRGLLALFGQSSGVVPPFDLQRLNQGGSLFVTRPSLAHYVASRDELEMRSGAVLSAVADGSLSVRIGARFALEDAAQAQAALESRATTGKLLLDVGGA